MSDLLPNENDFPELARRTGHDPSERHSLPFRWIENTAFFDLSLAQTLAAEFPIEEFQAAGEIKGLSIRSLVVNNALHPSAASLTSAWKRIGLHISSPRYRRELGNSIGRDLSSRRIDATFCRHKPGAFIPPHLDRAERDAAHILYFCPDWRREWGGLLLLLRSSRLQDIAATIEPRVNTSVVMVRSEQSWHAVSQVAKGIEKDRLSLLVFASSDL